MFKNWKNRLRKVPSLCKEDIFVICCGLGSDEDMARLRAYIEIYGIRKIDYLFKDGLNPLMCALENSSEGSLRIVRELVGAGSDITLRSQIGFSVFLATCKRRDCFDILSMALRSGVNPNEKMGNAQIGYVSSALGLAVTCSNEEAVTALISFGANTLEESGHLLAQWIWAKKHRSNFDEFNLDRHNRILMLLIKSGVYIDANISMSRNLTPLQYCVSNFNCDEAIVLVDQLCSAGANPNYINKYVDSKYLARAKNVTVLECCKDFRLIKILQERGLDTQEAIKTHFTSIKFLNLISQCQGPYGGELDCIKNLKLSSKHFPKICIDEKFCIKSRDGFKLRFDYDLSKMEARLKYIFENKNNSNNLKLSSLASSFLSFDE